eukprot:2427219-Pleurochrysis_carterae.AAC.1
MNYGAHREGAARDIALDNDTTRPPSVLLKYVSKSKLPENRSASSIWCKRAKMWPQIERTCIAQMVIVVYSQGLSAWHEGAADVAIAQQPVRVKKVDPGQRGDACEQRVQGFNARTRLIRRTAAAARVRSVRAKGARRAVGAAAHAARRVAHEDQAGLAGGGHVAQPAQPRLVERRQAGRGGDVVHKVANKHRILRSEQFRQELPRMCDKKLAAARGRASVDVCADRFGRGPVAERGRPAHSQARAPCESGGITCRRAVPSPQEEASRCRYWGASSASQNCLRGRTLILLRMWR